MGWLQGLRFKNSRQLLDASTDSKTTGKSLTGYKTDTAHIEYVHVEDEQNKRDGLDATCGEAEPEGHHDADRLVRHFQNEDVPDSELPFIPKEEVASKKREAQILLNEQKMSENEDLWIVVDNVVYDCSEFVTDHPGGEQVIRSFQGEDCSWQFWRFHGKQEMLQHGRALRIGRTAGVPNRFTEVPRYVGLSRNRDDDW